MQAVNDVENIAEFISKDSERYAVIQTQRFFEIVLILETNIYIGRIVPEFNNEVIRELILGNYRIIYHVISENIINILTVHHSKRLLSNNLFSIDQ
ncbi:MAG: type II toxin-antitoxin system RelE/ParE family toxin [Janthinobacterium lividum]